MEYNLGMIVYKVATGERPFGERSHGNDLVCDIYNGVRPKIPNNVPQLFKFIIEKCWDPIPENRPTAWKLEDFIYSIRHGYTRMSNTIMSNTLHVQYCSSLESPKTDEEIKECFKLEKQKLDKLEEISIPTNMSKKQQIHSNAVYTSRMFTSKIISIPTNTGIFLFLNIIHIN